MKKLIGIGILFCSCTAFAVDPGTVNIASFTQTNDAIACIVNSTGPGGSPVVTPHYLDKVDVGVASGAGSVITLFNSTFTNTPVISSITLTSVQNHNYENLQVRGICYTTVGNTGGVTIIYKK